MGAAFFYHLTRNPLDVTLPQLIGKARAAGWRVLVRAPDLGRVDWLDQKLWLGPEDSFLAHGVAGGEHDALQPVLLTAERDGNPNKAECLMTVDGAAIRPEDIEAAERCCILFDGHDLDAVALARTQWKALTSAGCAAQYWSEESGQWQKKADTSEA